MHGLIQRLADLGAGLEGRPVQPVPRLDNDLALPDQLAVMVGDLALLGEEAGPTAGPVDEVLRSAAAEIDATARF
jgi:hypothetical protein